MQAARDRLVDVALPQSLVGSRRAFRVEEEGGGLDIRVQGSRAVLGYAAAERVQAPDGPNEIRNILSYEALNGT